MRLTKSKSCPLWYGWTLNLLWHNSAKQSTLWSVAKHEEKTWNHKVGNLPCLNNYTNCYVSAREKVMYPQDMHNVKITTMYKNKDDRTTAITTGVSLCWALLAKSSHAWSWLACKSSLNIHTQSHSVVSELRGQQWTRFSQCASSKKNVENKSYSFTSPLLI